MAELPIVLGITGASGAAYAVRLLDVLLARGATVQLMISPAGQAVLRQELGLEVDLDRFSLDQLLPRNEADCRAPRFEVLRAYWPQADRSPLCVPQGPISQNAVQYFHYNDLFAPPASGSARSGGMVVCPCSGGTLSAIAHGSSGNLIQRAADVQLKERRKLILVPRETPLSVAHIDNMRRATEAGAVVLPAMPGFYHGARSIGDLVDFVVSRILDQLGVPNDLVARWGAT